MLAAGDLLDMSEEHVLVVRAVLAASRIVHDRTLMMLRPGSAQCTDLPLSARAPAEGRMACLLEWKAWRSDPVGLTAYQLVLPDHPLGRRQKAEAVRRRRCRPSMCGRPDPATAKVLPTRPSKDGSGRGGSAPGTSAKFTKYARTGPIPSRF
jgi:hypothetical protein